MTAYRTWRLGATRRRNTMRRLAAEYLSKLPENATRAEAYGALAAACVRLQDTYPDTFGQAARRMGLAAPNRVRGWLDHARTWTSRARPEFPRLFEREHETTDAPVTCVEGEPDADAKVIEAPSGTAPDEHRGDMRQTGDGEGSKIGPLDAGAEGAIDYQGEPRIRALVVDAIRERRRGRALRGLDSGELDLGRIARTALGVDLERAFERRIRPDLRGVAVWIALDTSGSMLCEDSGGGTRFDSPYGMAGERLRRWHFNPRTRWHGARRAAAFTLRALERERVACGLEAYNGHSTYKTLRPFGSPIGPALEALGALLPGGDDDAPAAAARGAAALSKRAEPRRVLVVICDDAIRVSDERWEQIAAGGIEIWIVSICNGAKAISGAREELAGVKWCAHHIVSEPEKLVDTWSAALREHLGRVNA